MDKAGIEPAHMRLIMSHFADGSTTVINRCVRYVPAYSAGALPLSYLPVNGTPSQVRTVDPRVKSSVLYLLS